MRLNSKFDNFLNLPNRLRVPTVAFSRFSPAQVYKQKVVDIFQRISKEVAGDVPLKVINDGEAVPMIPGNAGGDEQDPV